jgi:hypothetical protein
VAPKALGKTVFGKVAGFVKMMQNLRDVGPDFETVFSGEFLSRHRL